MTFTIIHLITNMLNKILLLPTLNFDQMFKNSKNKFLDNSQNKIISINLNTKVILKQPDFQKNFILKFFFKFCYCMF